VCWNRSRLPPTRSIATLDTRKDSRYYSFCVNKLPGQQTMVEVESDHWPQYPLQFKPSCEPPFFYWLFEATEDGRYSDIQTPARGWYWRYSQTINEVSHTQCAQYRPVLFFPWFSSGNHGSCSPALPEGLKGTENLPSLIIYLSPLILVKLTLSYNILIVFFHP